MAVPADTQKSHVLQPIERLSEVLFGLIMVLTFTGSLSVAAADRNEVKLMLIGAVGCNIAWGLIDAIMYLMACLHERGATRQTIRAVLAARTADEAHAAIRSRVPRVIADEMDHGLLERIRLRLSALPMQTQGSTLTVADMRGACGVFLIVVASTLPVVLPFIFMEDVARAMRLSNAIAVLMLAVIGFLFGRASGFSPWWTSAAMVLLGCILVAITIALGG